MSLARYTKSDVDRMCEAARRDAAERAWTNERRDVLAIIQEQIDRADLGEARHALAAVAFILAHGHHVGAAGRAEQARDKEAARALGMVL